MKIPDPNKDYVKSFCKGISNNDPILVPLRPLSDKPLNDCFSIVPEHILSHGGEQAIGWTIWEWSPIYIDAEFHMVWNSKDGTLIDIAPKPEDFSPDSILFLPDPEKQYRGKQVDNIRQPFVNDFLVSEFLNTAKKRFKAMNKGDLAYHHGEIEATRDMIKLNNKMIRLKEKVISKYGRST